ncbi:galactose mutarotase-like enzyme [Breznakia sp. PF5-3]|uniref:aldose 1-epimerase family protein n=1 Tax=unclassified Breznakia TaxID=2623764 RepID=UPI00240570EB|nr:MULTISPECIES: aldose 1-epimerase family protein [unclassified Breznakia]MDF9824151.1 galactose mutarotase-like enzyme [Breznakia sp. PM6-1]MDF9834949.1 galactose mutarotase-like enzyme [Breznakia sp. PF5-3]MDF9837182.1 galactose mutarotase-like enzyme [Breznakia sp. PFB2-8]MDF9859172.1 galactose mutarotase-like enzyme [Breznakia sp. PH5-24]
MKIFNNRFEVEFTTLGGEMTSFKDKETGIEYLWQGDEKYWSGKNPTLFPIVGNTYNGTYEVDGKTYTFKNHGLIRYADLQCVEQSDTMISFALYANQETKKVYPFDFTYKITYKLVDNKIEIYYAITNNDQVTMPFTFGLHPGFRCPLEKDEKFEDYQIVFEKEEKLQQLIFDPNKKVPHTYTEVSLKSIPMDYAMFEKYLTLIYKGMKSSYVTLKGPKHEVKVTMDKFPLLALWSPTQGAPFVCIEPWYSHGDFEKVDLPFAKREGMMNLTAGETFTTSYSIEVL